MALQQSIKAPRRQAPKTRDPMFTDEKYTGREPVWDTDRALAMPQHEFDHFLRKSFSYYNYYFSQKDLKKHAVKWLQENKYTKAQVSAFVRSSDRSMTMTAYGLLMAHRQGMPFREKELAYFKTQIESAITAADAAPEESATGAAMAKKPVATAVKLPTIQDRLNEKTSEHLAYFEGLYDEVVTGGVVDPKAYDYLTTNAVPQSQINKFVELFAVRKGELLVAQERRDDQVVESYKHYKATDYKRHHAFIQTILDALEQYRGVKKTMKKIRAKKLPSKEKLVSKMKYAKDYAALKLMSISPADIIGASELWVYNIKTRKLFKYVADSLTGPLGIKGTSLTGFDAAKSVGKVLRKPEEKLKEFARASKVQLRKFLEEVKATETLGNGRINSDTVLLKVQ
jgi:hypothetical protein